MGLFSDHVLNNCKILALAILQTIKNHRLFVSTKAHFVNSILIVVCSIGVKECVFCSQGFQVPERDFHTATAVKSRVIVFGGRSEFLGGTCRLPGNNGKRSVFLCYH